MATLREQLIDAAEYPLDLRIAASLFLQGITETKCVKLMERMTAVGITGPEGSRYAALKVNVHNRLRDLYHGHTKITPRLKELAERC